MVTQQDSGIQKVSNNTDVKPQIRFCFDHNLLETSILFYLKNHFSILLFSEASAFFY